MDLQQFLASEGPAAITPECLHPEELVDVSKMACLRPFFDEFRFGTQVKKNLALLRQRMIGLASRRLQHSASKSGARIVARIDPELFHEIRTNYGPEAWTDPKLRADTLKRHPEMAVVNGSPRLTLQVNGRRHSSETPNPALAPAPNPSPKRLDQEQDYEQEKEEVGISGGRYGAQRDAATALDCLAHECPPPESSVGRLSPHHRATPNLAPAPNPSPKRPEQEQDYEQEKDSRTGGQP